MEKWKNTFSIHTKNIWTEVTHWAGSVLLFIYKSKTENRYFFSVQRFLFHHLFYKVICPLFHHPSFPSASFISKSSGSAPGFCSLPWMVQRAHVDSLWVAVPVYSVERDDVGDGAVYDWGSCVWPWTRNTAVPMAVPQAATAACAAIGWCQWTARCGACLLKVQRWGVIGQEAEKLVIFWCWRWGRCCSCCCHHHAVMLVGEKQKSFNVSVSSKTF